MRLDTNNPRAKSYTAIGTALRARFPADAAFSDEELVTMYAVQEQVEVLSDFFVKLEHARQKDLNLLLNLG
jgi:hypothetical protein